jgi:hypothetical protein
MPTLSNMPTAALQALWRAVHQELQLRAERALVAPGADPADEGCDLLEAA